MQRGLRSGIVLAATAVMAAAALVWLVFFAGPPLSLTDQRAFLDSYCRDCHNAADLAGGLDLGGHDPGDLAAARETWEQVVRKLRIRMMPPSDAASPPRELRSAMVRSLETGLDAVPEGPEPGPALIRRLNRAEYANAIRDLLALEVDATTLLPPDDAAYGFDNNAEALVSSPLLIDQYLSAAGKIAALAVGDPEAGPAAHIFRFRQDGSQNVPAPGMPVGTLGGGLVDVVLPLDGEYRLDVRYYKSNLGAMKGLELPVEVEIAVDGERIHRATIGGREDFEALMRNITEGADAVEARSSTTAPLTAGAHKVSVGFVYRGAVQTSVRLQAFERSSQDTLDVTGYPHIETLTITGPYGATSPGDTASRRRIFACRPEPSSAAESDCARDILARLARVAYRGQQSDEDVATLLAFFDEGRARRDFDAGIQLALERLLSSPKFLFRAEQDPAGLPAGTPHAVSDLELASRLSFFLWSSVPDTELLDLAESGGLGERRALEAEVRRMLADPRADALTENFAGQWLYLRNLESMIPNSAGFPNFDDNLRQAMLRETELFFEHIVRADRPVTELMTADYSFLNERIARHYGIDTVYGNHFRRVTLDDPARFGLLGKASVLMVSSHTDRTSPVVRGKWVLENLLGTPPPAPPDEVPPLPEAEAGAATTLRERLVAHRENPSCASCHALMDPIGFALENFDAVGAWRDNEYGSASPPIDARGTLVGGIDVDGPVELRTALMAEPGLFVSTVVEKLMVYALGRGLVASDMPVVRGIVRDTERRGWRFGDIVLGIVESAPFRMRARPDTESATN